MSGVKRKAKTSPRSPPPACKPKFQSTTSQIAVANFFTPSSQKPLSSLRWHEKGPSLDAPATLLVGQYEPESHPSNTNTKLKAKIAAFDLDSTLITTASGKKFATEATDWKWWDPKIPEKLRSLHKSGFSLAIISNQGGLMLHPNLKLKAPKKQSSQLDNFKTKLKAILSCLQLPVIILAATGKDVFRKPRPGMWDALLEELGISKPHVDLEASFFVGDAGGRVASEVSGTPKDFSCSDRNFAHNIGITYQTPEEYFQGHSARDFLRDFDLDQFTFDDARSHDKNQHLHAFTARPQGCKDLVLFCGPPGAGKSSFYHKFLADLGYARVNQDALKSKEKCFKLAIERLREGTSVVIDNTNPDPQTRSLWISLAGKEGATARCVWFRTPIVVCEHNDAVRAMNKILNPESRQLLPKIAFNTFRSRYKEPSTEEGFTDIIPVDFYFSGTADEYQVWAKYWL